MTTTLVYMAGKGKAYVDKFLESRIGTFFLFKFILSEQLMSTISDERLKMRSSL